MTPFATFAELRAPQFLAGLQIQGDGVIVEQVVDELAAADRPATQNGVAASLAESGGKRLGIVHPLQRRARLCQVEREGPVREGRDGVHCVAKDKRRAFIPYMPRRRTSMRPSTDRHSTG